MPNRFIKLQNKLSSGPSMVGLNIDESSIKVAQMARYKGKWTLVKADLINIEAKDQENKMMATQKALKKSLNGINLRKSKVVCVINCPKTCARQISTPSMPKSELPEAIRWESRNHIPFSLDEAIIDFKVLDQHVDKGNKKLDIMMAATTKETINNLLELMDSKSSGNRIPSAFKVSAVIPMSIALQNIQQRSKEASNKTIVVMEMGEMVTELNIYKNGSLQFSRKLPIAGHQLTECLKKTLVSQDGKVELTHEEAEQIKLEYGIPAQGSSEKIFGKITLTQVLSLLQPKIEQLANEVERSFDFYREERGGKIDSMILFGGSSQLKGLKEFLAKELDVEVKLGNPMDYVPSLPFAVDEKKDISNRLDLAIGAALHSNGGINLLPIKWKKKTQIVIDKIVLYAFFLLILAGSSFFTYSLNLRSQVYERSLRTMRHQYNRMIPFMTNLYNTMLVEDVIQNRPPWKEYLKELSNIVPPGVYIDQLSMNNNEFIMRGVIPSTYKNAETILSNMMMTLEKRNFKNVTLVTTRKIEGDDGRSEFEIRFGVD